MVRHILKCRDCGRYTMQETCSCGGLAVICIPPKYTPSDPYAKYRRIAKEKSGRDQSPSGHA